MAKVQIKSEKQILFDGNINNMHVFDSMLT